MASLAGRGRAKIRPPRRGLNGADVDFDGTWSILERAFNEIHTKNASALSFEELYRSAYKIVLKKKGEELYNKVAQFEANWLGNNVRARIVQQLTTPLLTLSDASVPRSSNTVAERKAAGASFLRTLKQAWEDHQLCMGMLTDVLMYMDRVYCTDHRQPSIFAKAMGLFRDQILRSPARQGSPELIQVLTSIILDQIQMDRDGEGIDQHLIKSNVYMLEGLYESDQEVEDEKLYLQLFEPVFLETSQAFYQQEGERLLKESDAGTYCREAKRRIDEESDRCRSTLSESTTAKIQSVVEHALIKDKMRGLIQMESGVKYMVENDKFQELALVFELEARVDAKKTELTEAMKEIIKELGTEICNAAVAASQTPPAAAPAADEQDNDKAKAGSTKQINQQTVAALKWVKDILALKERFDHVWKTSFGSDQTISTALTESLAKVINFFQRGSEFISLFIDENMKKGIKDKTEAEIDATLEQAITTLRYISDKDLFETYYRKHLCKRLLLKKSVSVDVEKQMISRMKIELGNIFTGKFEGMFKDMSVSEDLTRDYRAHALRTAGADPKRVDLSVNILTAMTWPLEAFRSGAEDGAEGGPGRARIIFPGAIERIKTGFENFYNEQHSGRRLTWQTNMGDADLKATFPRSKNGKPMTHEINCSTYAMLILLLFNDVPAGGRRTYEEIQAATNIPENDLKRNLQSLAVAPKTRFLVKEPMSREINAGDQFSFNEGFTSKIVRIKVGVVSAGNKVEGERERRETEKKNNDSRQFSVEAAVVRIMKQRKLLPHAQLLTETLAQLHAQFQPDVNMIKKRIESLIEREYLERVEEAPVPSYRYLA